MCGRCFGKNARSIEYLHRSPLRHTPWGVPFLRVCERCYSHEYARTALPRESETVHPLLLLGVWCGATRSPQGGRRTTPKEVLSVSAPRLPFLQVPADRGCARMRRSCARSAAKTSVLPVRDGFYLRGMRGYIPTTLSVQRLRYRDPEVTHCDACGMSLCCDC